MPAPLNIYNLYSVGGEDVVQKETSIVTFVFGS